MSEQSQGPGWWVASDGRWYPPETHPNYRPPPPPPAAAARPPAQPVARPRALPPEPLERAPRRRDKRGTPLWKLALGVCLGLFLFIAVCSAIVDTGVDTGDRVDTGGSAQPGPSDDSDDEGGVHPMGTKVQLRDGSTVQVFSFVAPVPSPSQFYRPDQGKVFASIEVEGCAGAQAQQFGVNPFSFALGMPDNSRVTTNATATKEPELHAGPQPAGTCNRGWVNYQIPDGVTPSAVLYEDFGVLVRWSV